MVRVHQPWLLFATFVIAFLSVTRGIAGRTMCFKKPDGPSRVDDEKVAHLIHFGLLPFTGWRWWGFPLDWWRGFRGRGGFPGGFGGFPWGHGGFPGGLGGFPFGGFPFGGFPFGGFPFGGFPFGGFPFGGFPGGLGGFPGGLGGFRGGLGGFDGFRGGRGGFTGFASYAGKAEVTSKDASKEIGRHDCY